MKLAAQVAAALVGALHVYFMVLEMFLWNRPFGRRTFGLTPEFAAASRSLAANQGLYNGFLAAGIAWGLWLGAAGRGVALFCIACGPGMGAAGRGVTLFFLACVVVAGVFGALSVSRKILLVQALPGAVALLLVLIAG